MSRLDFYLSDALLFGDRFEAGLGLLVSEGRIRAVLRADEAPTGARVHRSSGWLAPGYVEIQINGCGGVIFTQDPTVEAIERMDDVLRTRGVTAFLPTLITAPSEVIDAGIAATREAMTRRPSVLGMHLEGPHLSLNKPGTHEQALIRQMSPADCERILAARGVIRLLTIARETVGVDQIERLAAAGITLALGHTAASAEETLEAHRHGVAMLTHLYNGMPPLSGREPGPVGAAMTSDTLSASIIVDGFHVHDASVRAAAALMGDRLVLTSDATASVEGGTGEFEFGGYRCRIEGGVVRNHTGGLAGAAILLHEVVQRMAVVIDDRARAVRMGSELPARLIGAGTEVGRLAPGLRANFNLLDPETLAVRRVWAGGEEVG